MISTGLSFSKSALRPSRNSVYLLQIRTPILLRVLDMRVSPRLSSVVYVNRIQRLQVERRGSLILHSLLDVDLDSLRPCRSVPDDYHFARLREIGEASRHSNGFKHRHTILDA